MNQAGPLFAWTVCPWRSDGPSKQWACTMLPDQAIDEYIKTYRKIFGVTLSRQEASFRANHLVNLYRAVLGPESSGKVKKVEKFGDGQSYDKDQ